MNNFKKKIIYDNAAILQQIQTYTDESRIIMEYIDNSIDAAESFYCPVKNTYNKKIEIKVIKKWKLKKNRSIKVIDNCSGMDIDTNKPMTIFNSEKTGDARTNGMFGFGMFSGLSICNKLSFKSKTGDSKNSISFEITPELFSKSNEEELSVEIKSELNNDSKYSGTIVILEELKSELLYDLNLKNLKKEIENHFELILSRDNISITLEDEKNTKLVCKQFKYEDFNKNNFHRILNELYITKSKKYKTLKKIDISSNPLEIFLIASKDTELNRDPVFIYKGRRIIEISKVDQFRTSQKSSIWSRSNVTGYIDVTGILEPTPTRKDFKKSRNSKALFQTLRMQEEEILKYIENQGDKMMSKELKIVEENINSILSEFRTEISQEGNKNEEIGYKVYSIKGYNCKGNDINLSKYKMNPNKKPNKPNNIINRKKTERNKIVTIKYYSSENTSSLKYINYTFRLECKVEPHKDINGNLLRSIIRDQTIILFQKHPDFQLRQNSKSKNVNKLNERIIYYISLEIVSHLSSMNIFESGFYNFASAVNRLEDKLNRLSGGKLH